jgi:hypothetical protein
VQCLPCASTLLIVDDATINVNNVMLFFTWIYAIVLLSLSDSCFDVFTTLLKLENGNKLLKSFPVENHFFILYAI